MIMKTKTLMIVLTLLALCSSLRAHEDTMITLATNRLQGLPEQYEPASFSYHTQTLAVGTNSVVIPAPIWKLFGDIAKDPIVFSASWYHNRRPGGLPDYLYIRNKNCEFLVNLKTLEMIDFMRDKKISQEALKDWNVTRPKIPQPEN